MERRPRDCVLLFEGLLLFLITLTQSATVRRRSPVTIPVGVILDLNSSLGSMALTCTKIARQDFYSENYNYSTTLILHFRHSANHHLTASSAAWDLINNEAVHAIVGPQNSEQARDVVELSDKYDVPMIWFSPSGPSLVPPRTPFFIHSNSTRSHYSQFEAIAAIIKAYNWQSVFPIYEDPQFGYDLIPCLSYALQDMDTRVPYISAISQNCTNDQITEELNRIKNKRARVFVAHMTVELWSRLVEPAQHAGMMSKGYAWILTQGLSSVLDPEALNVTAKGYMDYALGVKPSLSDSNKNKRISLSTTLMSEYGETLSLYGLWAYDTTTALANAVKNAGLVDYDVANGGMRTITGPKLRTSILKTNFSGLSGNFNLKQGQLEPSEFVVYNVIGQTERIIGYWRPEKGLDQNDSVVVVWPGNTEERPPKLKIGVTKANFIEFVNVNGEGQSISATGFAVEVFKKVVDALPFPLVYEFVPVMINPNGELTPSSYDDLLRHFSNMSVDADVIIGDITILTSRTKYVDFTMPYLDSSLSMVVHEEYDSESGWILFKPFDRDLWLFLGGTFVGATFIVIVMERRKKDEDESEFKLFVRNPLLIYLSGVESFKSGKSKWVVIVVTFMLGIAIQLYTANLTSMLIEKTMAKPSPWKDMQEIKKKNVVVGYQRDSWVKELLINHMKLKDDQLKALGSRIEYNKAISKRATKGGVDAIFDETPYLLLLLSNCPSCKMTGPIYKTGGFAFAFPKNSTLVSSFSTAILNVTQDVKMFHDMKKSISLPFTIDKSEYKGNTERRSLMIDDFGGFFPFVYSVLALFFSLSILKVPSVNRWLRSTTIFQSISSGVSSISLWLHNKLLSYFLVTRA